MKLAHGICLIGLLFLSACGSEADTSSNSNADLLRSVAASTVARVKGSEAAAEPMTRARLAEVVTPVMLLTVDASGKQALIAEIQTNQGVATWSTVDDITISLRNGVIVATRGFGADLMAAAVPAVLSGVGQGQSHRRVHTLLNGEDKPIRTQFTCTFRNDGSQVIDIVEVKYQATQITESCVASERRFENVYWISGDRQMRKSRQWISPEVGFLTIQDVRR